MDTTSSGGAGGGWESVPEDIFHLIVEKFSNLQDSTSVSFVCKSWMSVSDSAILNSLVKKKLPLLIVPYNDHKGGGSSSVWDDTLGFISLFDDDDDDDDDVDGDDLQKKKKEEGVYKVRLPEIADRRICGSSEGWLISVHENTEVQLLNPITKVLVNLPPLSTAFPDEIIGKVVLERENYRGRHCYVCLNRNKKFSSGYDSQFFRDSFFEKVVTNSTTTTDHANNSTITTVVVVMAIYGCYRKLAFCRTSTGNNDDEQNQWKCCPRMDDGSRYDYYEDVTFYKGNFYAVDCHGGVVVVMGLDGPSPVPFLETIIQPVKGYSRKSYLVESLDSGGGDLLKVTRYIKIERINEDEKDDKEELPYRVIGFWVWKLDFNGGPSWEKVTNLGEDCALFVGYNHSFSFSASKFSGCKGNCIYFTYDNFRDFSKLGRHIMGVYNLEDDSVEKLNYENTSSMPPPFWYVPRASTSLPALTNNKCVEKQREMKKQQGLFNVFSPTPTPTITSSTTYIPPFCSETTTANTSFARLLEKKLPLLIVPYDHKGDGGGFKKERRLGSSGCADTLGFISLFHSGNHDDELRNKEEEEEEESIYKVYLPEIAERRICGSSEGWLITVHKNSEVQLLNPISKVLVHLPPLTTFPNVLGTFISEEIVGELVPKDRRGLCYIVKEDRVDGLPCSPSEPYLVYDSQYFRQSFFKKVVTSTTDANSTVPTVVMAIYGTYDRLACCRPSGNGIDDGEQNKWICFLEEIEENRNKIDGCYDDVTYYKGNFYAVGHHGDVVVVKGLDGPSPFLESIIERGPEYYYSSHKNYLVDSSSSSSGGDDLLEVQRNLEYEIDNEEISYRTIGFSVWKLDFNGGPSWEKVTNLGEDRALFIGYNRSISFSASKFPGCRGNCIYFTDNNSILFHNNPYGGYDMGVYNLEDDSIEKLNYEATTGSFMPPPPIWYVPNSI